MNDSLTMTLDEAVAEVLAMLTGLDLRYDPNYDRYRAIARTINRALRSVAREHDWSYYSALEEVAIATPGMTGVELRSSRRLRVLGDDAVRLTLPNGEAVVWAYVLPRDALHKYAHRQGLWCAFTRTTIQFSRPLTKAEEGLRIMVPVMREPKMFEIPTQPEDDQDDLVPMPQAVRDQLVDFDYPDLVILRAAFFYAQTDPVMQPRVPTLEAQYKDLMYQLIEQDERKTDSPYLNDFAVPLSGSIEGNVPFTAWNKHPHADERR